MRHDICVCVAIHVLTATTVGAAAPPRFILTDLGLLPGGTQSRALGINEHGVVVGFATGTESAAYAHAVAWIDGEIVDLTGVGVSGASANALNGAGTIVGISDDLPFPLNAFVWERGEIDPLPAPFICCSEAKGINDAGVIIGQAAVIGGGTPNQAVKWIDGEIVPLPSLGFDTDFAHGINESGVIVGFGYDGANYRAVRWTDEGVEPLSVPIGTTWSEAAAINNSGLIVGHVDPASPGFTRAATWVDDAFTLLPGLTQNSAYAQGVNDAGWIVGWAIAGGPGSARATLWVDGVAHDLNALVVNLPAGTRLTLASDVNAHGEIVGTASDDVTVRAFLLTPVHPADLNADGTIDGSDLAVLLGSWGPCAKAGECPADFDGSGLVDGTDLAVLLGAWTG